MAAGSPARSPQGCLSSCCSVLHALTAAPNPSRPGGTGSSLHCLEPPGLKASLALDFFQSRPLEPLFPRGPCSLLQAKGTSYQRVQGHVLAHLYPSPPTPPPAAQDGCAHRLPLTGTADMVKGGRVLSGGPGKGTNAPASTWREGRRQVSTHHTDGSVCFIITLSDYIIDFTVVIKQDLPESGTWTLTG